MSKKNKPGPDGIVYSTDPNYRPFADLFQTNETSGQPAAQPSKQILRIWLQRVKGGKEATVIKGFTLPDSELQALAKLLKNKCAGGGGAKDGEIIIQGNHREKLLTLLRELGYNDVKLAGG